MQLMVAYMPSKPLCKLKLVCSCGCAATDVPLSSGLRQYFNVLQVTSDILAAYKLAEVHAAAAPDFAAAMRAAAAELITALEVVSGQGLCMA